MTNVSSRFGIARTARIWGALVLRGLLTVALSAAVVSAQAAGGGITVEGKNLLKDGKEWIPHGFTMVSFVAPEKSLAAYYKPARDSFGAPILERAHSLGADLLRFQVSQVGLDEQSSIYDPEYLGQVLAAVKKAREAGFSVIVSMQWEPPSGLKGQPMMPSDITRRAWTRLAGSLANDEYVMLELFNEPGMWETTPSAWPTWQSGMQSLVDLVRRDGAKNVLLLDGLRGAHYLKDAPRINDPMNKIVYAIHPYFDDKDNSPADWTRDFGNFATSHAVLATEWNATSTLQCRPDEPEVSHQLIDYLKERRIGLVLWALDDHATLFDGSENPIGFKGFQCGKWGTGAAYIAIQSFKAQ